MPEAASIPAEGESRAGASAPARGVSREPAESPDEGTCSWCGLPVRRDRRSRSPSTFCCTGCRIASEIAPGPDGRRRFLEARLMLSAVFAMGTMTFGFILYADEVYSPARDQAGELVRLVFQWGLALFSLPVLLLLGLPILRSAVQEIREGQLRMDGLIVTAVGAAWALSIVNMVRGETRVYFETASTVLVLLVFGKRLEMLAREAGRDAGRTLQDLLPEKAHRIESTGECRDVPVATIVTGDRVRVPPGEAAPADLRIEEGESEVSLSHLTGESRARDVRPGDALPAGAVNGCGLLIARVESPALQGSLGRIRELLERPLDATRIIRVSDRLAGRLFGVALVLSALAAFLGWRKGGLDEAMQRSLSVLLVACPCALGLAIPLAYRAMRANLARRGLLVRDIPALERAARISQVFMDKTGTLTSTAGSFSRVEASEPAAFARLEAAVLASGHALAKAVTAPCAPPDSWRIVPGAGVEARFGAIEAQTGSPRWIDAAGTRWPESLSTARKTLASEGATLVAHAEGGVVRALAALLSPLRSGAREAVDRLRAMGVSVRILSGDEPAAVERIGRELGIEGEGALLPADKIREVVAAETAGRFSLFVGDGINDAAAIRAASVGAAMASGTRTARVECAVELVGDDLSRLPPLLRAGRILRRTVIGNLTWTMIYNGAAFYLAVSGSLRPIAAAALMVGSSLVVSLRSARLLDRDLDR